MLRPERTVPHLSGVSDLYKFVADPVRLGILLTLCEGEKHVGALVGAPGQSRPTISQHLTTMRRSEVVEPRREGKRVYYRLTALGHRLVEAANSLKE